MDPPEVRRPAAVVGGADQASIEQTSSGSTTPGQTQPDDGGSEEPQTWTAAELLEIRARERTFDGAYWRTSVGLFDAALIVLRVFGLVFYPVGLVFLALGLGFMAIGITRRLRLINRDRHAHSPVFVTSGSTVALSAAMCIAAYAALLVLLVRI